MTQGKRPSPSPSQRLLVRARLTLTFEDPQHCQQAQAALAPESEGFLEITSKEDELHLSAPEARPGRILATLDDTIACLQAAEGSRQASRARKGK